MIQLAPGVRPLGLKPETLLAITIAGGVFAHFGADLKILSMADGDHSGGQFSTSSHYAGNSFDAALDPEIAGTKGAPIIEALKLSLGENYFINVNQALTHIHVAYMPQKP